MAGREGTRDLYALFGLPEAYEVDLGALSRKYHALQQHLHPDRFATAGDAERRRAVQQAAEVNDAFQTLKDPLKRARHLLARAGIATEDETDTVMDPGFLMQQLEWREQLEEVRHMAPSARLERLSALEAEASLRLREREQVFAAVLREDPMGARAIVREMQFLRRLAGEADSLAAQEEP